MSFIARFSSYLPEVLLSKPENDVDMPTIIRKMVKEFGETGEKINSGSCEEFAERLWEVSGGEMLELPFAHLWVKWRGKHYDAEALEGVASWRSLPFFKRNAPA